MRHKLESKKEKLGKYFWIILGCSFLSVSVAAQPAVDGFMKGKGNLDAVAGVTVDNFSKYYAAPGLLNIGRTTTSASAFFSAGLLNWLDVQVNVPYVMTANNWSNLQEVSSFVKARAVNKDLKNGTFSLLGAFGFSTPMTNYPTQGLNAIGQQATAFDSRLVVQYFKKGGWFFMAQGGYTSRSNPTPASVPIAAKVGKAASNYYFDFYYDYQEAQGGTDYRDGSNSPFTTLGVSYHKIGGTYYRPFSNGKMGFAAGAYGVLFGRNVGQSIGVNLAYIYKVKYLKE